MIPTKAMEVWDRLREGALVSDEDVASLKTWLSNPEHRRLFHAHLQMEGELNELLREGALSPASQRRGSGQDQHPRMSPATLPYRFPWKAVGSIAVLFMLVYTISFMGELFEFQPKDKVGFISFIEGRPRITRGKLHWALSPTQEIKVGDRLVTSNHEELEFMLMDGSLLWLGPNSSFTVPEDFELTQNLLLTSGVLHLDVVKRKKALEITMNRMRIKVMGTRFTLRHQPEKEFESVHLQEGKVLVYVKGEDDRILEPGVELNSIKGSKAKVLKKAPYQVIKGVIEELSPDGFRLKSLHGKTHDVRISPKRHESIHATLNLKELTVGQRVRMEVIEAVGRPIKIEELDSLDGVNEK